MYQIGFALIESKGKKELQTWIGAEDEGCAPAPNPVLLPNGDHVHCMELNVDYNGYVLIAKYSDDVPQERIIIDGSALFDRLTDQEYSAMMDAAIDDVPLARWLERIRIKGNVNLADDSCAKAKDAMIAAAVFDKDRADVIFAAP